MQKLHPIRLREQARLTGKDSDYVDSLHLSFDEDTGHSIPPYLGLSAEGWSSYYVGATWLKEGHRPLVVLPKFDEIDFLSIFAEALNDEVAPQYFKEAYRVNFDAPAIQEGALNSILSPLMVAHYMSVINELLRRGLKRNYVVREENLKSKVRGHILTLKNFQKNTVAGHSERTLCRFQEYSVDYAENQLLKRALLAAESLLHSVKATDNALLYSVRKALTHFEGVSADILPYTIKTIRSDKLHGEYPLAISIAKNILRRTDFSISENEHTSQYVPEFAIDMSRIFEYYVLGLLKRNYKNQEVRFQESAGVMGRCDYLIPSAHLVVDAKYKLNYLSPSRTDTLREDVREIAGYGRSKIIRQAIKQVCGLEDHELVRCLIVYPDGTYDNNLAAVENDILEKASPLKDIADFYTLGVPLPSFKREK